MSIKPDEGHGRLDGKKTGPLLSRIPKCRFNVPFFPLDETVFIQGVTKDVIEDEAKQRKNDLLKIRKYLVRQTYTEGKLVDYEGWKDLKKLSFPQFLVEVGMYKTNETTYDEAKQRYLSALSASVKGSGAVFIKRDPKDIFCNNFNPNLMYIHGANHDLQICVDMYACAQYICGYITKNEDGMSKLLKEVNDDAADISKMDLLNKLAAVLDKHREVSIQEATYRLLGFPMTKSSLKVKYISTVHPNFRDGLLRGDLKNLDDGEPIFHNSVHTYYENRPFILEEEQGKVYNPEELEKTYWTKLTISDFWSKYDVIYEGRNKAVEKQTNSIKLLNNKGYIKRRSRKAILRYYLPYESAEDFCRACLILFFPFRDEMEDIHSKDVIELFGKHKGDISIKRKEFEAYEVMTDTIKDIQKLYDEHVNDEEDDKDEEDNKSDKGMFVETTAEEEITDFDKWLKKQAQKDLNSIKQFTSIESPLSIRKSISSLNEQQRKIFDDIIEREITGDDKEPYYVFIAGEAGTGKSFLVRVLMEGIKFVNIKAGSELQYPSIIAMAPTANAAYIVGAKTIDSAMCLGRGYGYDKLGAQKESNLKFKYDQVSTLFCDEISMVGSSKLTKINFRMQDFADGEDKKRFMGARSFIATGDMWQLPPVKDRFIFEKNHLDGRPDCSPSHWDDNFVIYYMTEKMRSQQDPKFGEVCDRIGKGCLNKEDDTYLRSLIRKTPTEDDNEAFKTGKVSIIVTTNKKRETINKDKLDTLLPGVQSVICSSKDEPTNVSNAPELPEDLNYTETGNLQKTLRLKLGCPVMLTVNHTKAKYREDGITNGARAYVDSFQFFPNTNEVKYIWLVFKDERIGKLVRFENRDLLQNHTPNNPKAVPLEFSKRRFNVKSGDVSYQRKQFPAVVSYAVTSHRSQGDTLEEVIIDFRPEPGQKAYITEGSFYVAITRATRSDDVYLADFDESYIKVNKNVMQKIETMRKFKSYKFKKTYFEDKVFQNDGQELKLAYLNVNDLTAEFHTEYINLDKNLSNVDILVIADTRLTKDFSDSWLQEKLDNFIVIARYDSGDLTKHMGLLALCSKKSKLCKLPATSCLRFTEISMSNSIQTHMQIMIVQFIEHKLNVAFLYIRRKPSVEDINNIQESTKNCSLIFGDLNLNPQDEADKIKLHRLCSEDKYLALNEVTTNQQRQLDHIIALKTLQERIYTTSYFNFVSDHKTIGARVSVQEDNPFCKTFLQTSSFSFQNYSFSRKRPHESIKEKKRNIEKKFKRTNIKVEEDTAEISSDSEVDENTSAKSSLKNLEEECWLTDINIDDYGKLLKEHFKDDIFIFSTQFYIKLVESGYEGVKRWEKNVDIFDMKYIFYPMFENSHWFLGIQNNLTNKLQLLDPYDPSYKTELSSKNSQYEEDILRMKKDSMNKIVRKHRTRLENIMNLFLKKHERCHNRDFQIEVLVPPAIPEQTNDYDCGVFLLEFMKFTAYEERITFTCDEMPNFRKQIFQEMTRRTLLSFNRTESQNFRETSTSQVKPSLKRKSPKIPDVEYKKKRKEEKKTTEENKSKEAGVICDIHRIVNKDATSCWLNTCLQTLIIAIKSCSNCPQFNSDLGVQLLYMQNSPVNQSLDPAVIRQLLSEADESRIESEVAEYTQEYAHDPRELRRRLRDLNALRLNLGVGQQCVRDFFLCMRENRLNWLDVYTFLNHNVVDSVLCTHCRRQSVGVTREQLYTEIDCPTDGSSLSTTVQQNFHTGEQIEYNCQEGCRTQSLSMKRTALQDVRNTNFLIIILRRTLSDQGRPIIVTNDVRSTDNVSLVDIRGCNAIFEPISVVEHSGVLRRDGSSSGHYTACIKSQTSHTWWRTSDNSIPQSISEDSVTKRGYVILYKNITHHL